MVDIFPKFILQEEKKKEIVHFWEQLIIQVPTALDSTTSLVLTELHVHSDHSFSSLIISFFDLQLLGKKDFIKFLPLGVIMKSKIMKINSCHFIYHHFFSSYAQGPTTPTHRWDGWSEHRGSKISTVQGHMQQTWVPESKIYHNTNIFTLAT